MDRSYRNRLLREAVKCPKSLTTHGKFWKLDLWPHYLRRCDDILYGHPAAGLALTREAPAYAVKLAEAHPGVNGADLLILGHSYLGSAYRRNDDHARAEDAFNDAREYRGSASSIALAEYLRRLAYLRIFQMDPACFPIISDAITIHQRGNLVNRHLLGECLLCRGHAYFEFKQHGRSFDDWTAALNHLSIKIDPKPYYGALHNLTVWAVEYGTDEELQIALDNLKPAQALLSTFWGRKFGKLKLRWLVALVDARLGHHGRAEWVFLEVRDGLVKMKLAHELGMLQVDLALLYLAQGRYAKLDALVEDTARIYHRLGVEPKADETLDIWRKSETVTEDLLKHVRELFAAKTRPIPVGIAA